MDLQITLVVTIISFLHTLIFRPRLVRGPVHCAVDMGHHCLCSVVSVSNVFPVISAVGAGCDAFSCVQAMRRGQLPHSTELVETWPATEPSSSGAAPADQASSDEADYVQLMSPRPSTSAARSPGEAAPGRSEAQSHRSVHTAHYIGPVGGQLPVAR